MLRAGSKPPSNLRSSSSAYARMQWRACGWAGSTTSIRTSAPVSSRSTSDIAPTSRARCASPSGSRSEPASSSERRSSTRALGAPRRGEPRDADAAIAVAGLERHQAGGLEAAEQAAQVAGIELEPLAQRPDLAALLADLPQHAGRAERAVPCEEVVVERAHPLRDDPVEPAHLGDHRGIHYLTLVSDRRPRQPS